jgi:hypothetical protein
VRVRDVRESTKRKSLHESCAELVDDIRQWCQRRRLHRPRRHVNQGVMMTDDDGYAKKHPT